MAENKIKQKILRGRKLLKASQWGRSLETDQKLGKPAPQVQKDYPEKAQLVDLVPSGEMSIEGDLLSVLQNRRSRRSFSEESFSREEFSFLIWAVQGLNSSREYFRTSPSAGARHPFETYVIINKVEGIEQGLYRYLPLEHKLLPLESNKDLTDEFAGACLDQEFTRQSAVDFIWTALPYRTEWRYSILSHKVIAIDAGHVCQNLYLASEAIGGGTCAIGAYSQEKMDNLLVVDGEDEFAVYAAVTGKVK